MFQKVSDKELHKLIKEIDQKEKKLQDEVTLIRKGVSEEKTQIEKQAEPITKLLQSALFEEKTKTIKGKEIKENVPLLKKIKKELLRQGVGQEKIQILLQDIGRDTTVLNDLSKRMKDLNANIDDISTFLLLLVQDKPELSDDAINALENQKIEILDKRNIINQNIEDALRNYTTLKNKPKSTSMDRRIEQYQIILNNLDDESINNTNKLIKIDSTIDSIREIQKKIVFKNPTISEKTQKKLKKEALINVLKTQNIKIPQKIDIDIELQNPFIKQLYDNELERLRRETLQLIPTETEKETEIETEPEKETETEIITDLPEYLEEQVTEEYLNSKETGNKTKQNNVKIRVFPLSKKLFTFTNKYFHLVHDGKFQKNTKLNLENNNKVREFVLSQKSGSEFEDFVYKLNLDATDKKLISKIYSMLEYKKPVYHDEYDNYIRTKKYEIIADINEKYPVGEFGYGLIKEETGINNKKVNQIKNHPYKILNNMFGDLYIDENKLKMFNRLKIKRGGQILFDKKVNNDLVDLLTKRFNSRRNYDIGALETFKEIINMANIPVNRQSAKYKISKMEKGGEIDIRTFTSPNEMILRMSVIIGAMNAGNTSIYLRNEFRQIIDHLLHKNHIKPDEHKYLTSKYNL